MTNNFCHWIQRKQWKQLGKTQLSDQNLLTLWKVTSRRLQWLVWLVWIHRKNNLSERSIYPYWTSSWNENIFFWDNDSLVAAGHLNFISVAYVKQITLLPMTSVLKPSMAPSQIKTIFLGHKSIQECRRPHLQIAKAWLFILLISANKCLESKGEDKTWETGHRTKSIDMSNVIK